MDLLWVVTLIVVHILGVIVGVIVCGWSQRPLSDIEKRYELHTRDEHADGLDDERT